MNAAPFLPVKPSGWYVHQVSVARRCSPLSDVRRQLVSWSVRGPHQALVMEVRIVLRVHKLPPFQPVEEKGPAGKAVGVDMEGRVRLRGAHAKRKRALLGVRMLRQEVVLREEGRNWKHTLQQ